MTAGTFGRIEPHGRMTHQWRWRFIGRMAIRTADPDHCRFQMPAGAGRGPPVPWVGDMTGLAIIAIGIVVHQHTAEGGGCSMAIIAFAHILGMPDRLGRSAKEIARHMAVRAKA